MIAGIVCYYAVALKNRLRWDDALDVWGVHGVGGFLGIILLGIFRIHIVQSRSRGGWAAYGKRELLHETACRRAGFSSAWAFGFTYGMLWLINKVTPVRVDDRDEIDGLDASQHGETAYLTD